MNNLFRKRQKPSTTRNLFQDYFIQTVNELRYIRINVILLDVLYNPLINVLGLFATKNGRTVYPL